MILSRTMRMSDYDELKAEVAVVERMKRQIAWPSQQHPHRTWEYALALRAANEYAQRVGQRDPTRMRIADFGCGVGLLSPMMLALYACDVSMYEVWTYGNDELYAIDQMQRAEEIQGAGNLWRIIHRPLCELTDEDKGKYAIAFCISTLEHIGAYQEAFRDLLSSVVPGGLVFLTTDFADLGGAVGSNGKPYECDWMRPNGMWTPETYNELLFFAEALGFKPFCANSEAGVTGFAPVFGDSVDVRTPILRVGVDWPFCEEHRLVGNAGFASLCLLRVRW